MAKQRHFPFFPEHWKGEVALRMCSSAARGLWIDMMCEMHSAEPYGHLRTPTGVPITTAAQLARIVGESAVDVQKWLTELEAAEVFSKTDEGVIFSRRMVRDAAERHAWNQRQSRVRSRNGHSAVTVPVTDTVTQASRQSHATKDKGKGKRDTKVTSGANAPSVPLPDFGDLEPDVVAFLAVVAAANATGKISAGRDSTLRREIHEQIQRLGLDAMRYGLREATSRDKPALGYAIACAKGHVAKNGTAEPEHELASLDPLPNLLSGIPA